MTTPQRGRLAWLGTRLAEARLALMLLTRVPAGRLDDPVPTAAAASWAFPLAGLCVGVIAAWVMATAIRLGLPTQFAAGLALAAGIAATGALHEDGLADVADGFGGGRTRERKLEIMRDSAVGSYAVVALLLAIGLRWSALAAAADHDAGQACAAIVAIAVSSRSVLPLLAAVLPAARADGLGQGLTLPGRVRVVVAIVGGMLAPVLLLSGWAALAVVAGVAVAGAAIGWLARRQIGGQTGDVLGAVQQAAEVAAWTGVLVAVAW